MARDKDFVITKFQKILPCFVIRPPIKIELGVDKITKTSYFKLKILNTLQLIHSLKLVSASGPISKMTGQERTLKDVWLKLIADCSD